MAAGEVTAAADRAQPAMAGAAGGNSAAAAHVGGGGRGAFIWRTRPDFAAAASGLSGGAGAA